MSARAPLVDSHCHVLELDQRASALARAAEAGVTHVVAPAIRRADWAPLSALRADTLHVALGLHPWALAELDAAETTGTLAALPDAARGAHAVAIGECGLDSKIQERVSLDDQARALEEQARIADALGLPLILHVVGAHERALAALPPRARGVVHAFCGSLEQARAWWKRGFLSSLGPSITWPNARRIERVAREMPLEALLVESDGPDGRIDRLATEPASVHRVAYALARIRGVDVNLVAAATSTNARRLFDLA